MFVKLFFRKYLIILSGCFISATASTLEFKSYVDKTEVGLHETFTLNLEIQSHSSVDSDSHIEAPGVYKLKDFLFLGDLTKKSSSFSIIYGKMESKKTIVKSYQLKPKAIGVFKIPSMNIKVGKQTFQSSAFKIKVTANQRARPPGQQNHVPGFPNHFKLPSMNLFFSDPLKDIAGDFKFLVELSKKTVYKSEPLRVDWFFLSTSRIPQYQTHPILDLKGFWKEEVKDIQRLVGTKAIKDTLYKKKTTNRLWLFPLKSGALKIPVHSIEFLSFFNQPLKVLSSLEKTIQVKELPFRGRDLSFTGAVGSFELDFSFPKRDFNVNEPFSFKVTFKGSGHPRFIQLPYLALGSEFQAYDPVQKSSFSPEGIGTKEFEVLIVPKKEGSVVFPSLTLSTFDPQTEKYVMHTSPEYKIFVNKPKQANSSSKTFFDTSLKETNSSQLEVSEFFLARFFNYKNLFLFLKMCLVLLCFVILYLLNKKGVFKRKPSLNQQINARVKVIEHKLKQKTRVNYQTACIEMIDLLKFILDQFQTKSDSSHWRQSLKNLPPSLNKKHSKNLETLFKELEALSFSSQKNSTKIFQQSQALLKEVKVFKKDISKWL